MSSIVDTLQLPQGITISLSAKLHSAENAALTGDPKTAANIIGAFNNEVRAQSGKQISSNIADGLMKMSTVATNLLFP